jgi:hypothetical protein
MPRHRGLYWQQWGNCSICGFVWPIGQLIMQKGSLRCPRDVDNLDVELRPRYIAEVLSDTQETEDERVQVQNDPQTLDDLAF